MKMLRKVIPALMAAGLLAAASTAHAEPVSISAASVTVGGGYGVDDRSNKENGGQLLGVQFTSVFSAQELSFAKVGDRVTFELVEVAFSETDAGKDKDNDNGKEKNSGTGGNAGIRDAETDDLGVTATFTFANLPNKVDILGTGTATQGLVTDVNGDADVDYVLAWDPVEIDFGMGGKFRLSITTLSFSNVDTALASATLEMLAAPETGITAVPEPATLALVSLALAGAAVARRRRSA